MNRTDELVLPRKSLMGSEPVWPTALDFLAPTGVLVDAQHQVIAFGARLSATAHFYVGAPFSKRFDLQDQPILTELMDGSAQTAREGRLRDLDGTAWILRVWALHHSPATGEVAGFLALFSPAPLDESFESFGLVSRDSDMEHVFHLIGRVAEDAVVPVLFNGEAGCRLDRLALAAHGLSARAEQPFHRVSCGASTVESDLFGIGRSPGNIREVAGQLEAAGQGCVLLEGIEQLSTGVQEQLVEMFETQSIARPGQKPVALNAWVLATSENSAAILPALRDALSVRIEVPPLRSRKVDLEWLAEQALVTRRADASWSEDALRSLAHYDWPGNISELEAAVVHASVVGDGPVLTAHDLPAHVRRGQVPSKRAGNPSSDGLKRPTAAATTAHAAEVSRITAALEKSEHNRARAAKALGMSRVTLWRHMRALGLA